jgi:predicted RNase H-like HicB family nuclease
VKEIDQYHKWVEWDDTDKVYIGKCPDLMTGIHGDDPIALYSELCETLDEIINHFHKEGRHLPQPKTRPMQEVG